MTDVADMLENSVIIGAHPDDELLWFGSILRDVGEVILVYRDFWAHPGLGDARAAALAQHPHPRVISLDLEEAGTYGCADWKNPRLNDVGIEFTVTAGLREVRRKVRKTVGVLTRTELQSAETSIASAYSRNHALIRAALSKRLKRGMNVFTHNPWGEYGHEDHVQVFRVLEELRERIGFRLWISNYCTERSLPLAARYFSAKPTRYLRLPTDKAYCEEVAEVYRRTGCWTWANDWAWFDEECFMEAPHLHAPASPQRHLFPLNLFTIDEESPANWGKLAAGLSAASVGVGFALADAV